MLVFSWAEDHSAIIGGEHSSDLLEEWFEHAKGDAAMTVIHSLCCPHAFFPWPLSLE